MGKQIDIERIRIDGGTQMREHIDYHTVADYAEAYKAGVDMPELVVFHDGSDYWLADGFHRWHAGKRAGKDKMTCHVRSGSQREAILYAAGANGTNGLRRTPEDKMIAVRRLLLDDEWGKRSDRWIAEHARVSNHYVAEQRKQIPQFSTESAPSGKMGKRIGKDGREQPAKRIIRRPLVAPHVPPIDEYEEATPQKSPPPGKNFKSFDNEKNLIRALANLATLVKQTRYTAEFDKGRLTHELNQWANEIAEQTEAAESAA